MSLAFDDLFGEDRVAQYIEAKNILEAEEDGRGFDREDPREWATRFARDTNLRYFQGSFYDWTSGAYRHKADEVIESEAAAFLSTCCISIDRRE